MTTRDTTLLEYGLADRYMPDSAPDVLYSVITLHHAQTQIKGTGIQELTALPDLIPQLPV
jgi:hypothetical protein